MFRWDDPDELVQLAALLKTLDEAVEAFDKIAAITDKEKLIDRVGSSSYTSRRASKARSS
jgi:hypothetical protein